MPGAKKRKQHLVNRSRQRITHAQTIAVLTQLVEAISAPVDLTKLYAAVKD